MLDKYKKHQFIDFAKTKHKVTWSEIEQFFGAGITESKDFDYLLYKLDEEGIKVINDSFDKTPPTAENVPKKIVVKVKKSPEQLKLESETIKLNQLITYAKENDNKLTYEDLQSIMTLERIFTEDEKFSRTIDELQNRNIQIIDAEYNEEGTFIFKYSYDETIFESYINFDHPEMITLRKDVGQYKAQETEKYNKTFKEYIVKAYLDMGYSKSTIAKTYGISDEAINDWIFAYVNHYDPILPMKDGKYTFYPEGLKEKGRELHSKFNKSFEEIAITLQVYPSTVKRWIKRISETDIKNSIYEDKTYLNIKQKISPIQISNDLKFITEQIKNEFYSVKLKDLKSVFSGFYEANMGLADNDLPAPLNLKNSFMSISTSYITNQFYNAVLTYKKSNTTKTSEPVTPSTVFEAIIFCNRLSELCGLEPCYKINNSDVKLDTLLFSEEPVTVNLLSCDSSKNGFRLLSVDEYKYLCRKIIHNQNNDDEDKYPRLEEGFYNSFSHLLKDTEYTLSVNYKAMLAFVFKSHPELHPSDRPAILLLNKENSTDLYSYSEDVSLLTKLNNPNYNFMICSIQK